jgi:N-methylhydantoinase A
VINAYLAPLMSRYLLRLEERLKEKWATTPFFRVMQSNGGAVKSQIGGSGARPHDSVGPAGGVVGAFHVRKLVGLPRL